MLTVSGAAIFVVHRLLLLVSGEGIVRWSDVGRLDAEFVLRRGQWSSLQTLVTTIWNGQLARCIVHLYMLAE
jgi:hypothetical protein